MVQTLPRPHISYRPLTLAALDAVELPELEWVVHGLLPRGSLTLKAGREKGGKTLLATDLAASIAAGEPFLDRAVTPGPAILVAAEENLRDIRNRIRTRLGERTDVPLYVLPVNQTEDDVLDLANPAAIAGLERMITELEPALVVLDPFRELHQRAENDSDQMGPLLGPLRRLAHQTDTAIVLIHHMSRGGNFRGSTAIRAACDQEWAFRRPEDQASDSTELRGILTIEGRFGPRQTLGIRLGDDLRWQLTLQAVESSPSARAEVLAYLRTEQEPATAEEIAGAIGAELKTVQNVIADVRRKGQVPLVVLGMGRKGSPYRYELEELEELS